VNILIAEVILLIIFIIFFILGFYLIYKQVALVKKGEFSTKDRFQCFFYGLVFSLSVMVVIAVGFIFAVETPEFWQTTPPNINPNFLLIPFISCLLYLTVYPIIDFLFIALSKESDEGLTQFHRFISIKIINRYNKKSVAVILALIFYIMVFLLPPILLSLIGLPLIIIWITWVLVYPLMMLTFYGSKGYIAGITNAYYQIPDIKRSIFLNFEDPKRGMLQFKSAPGPYIILGLMLFVFVWAWISLIQTIGFFFTGSLAISTMSSGFVFVTLFFGIIGYFTRFWGRKIKYRGIDIYFAAYLMASIGINVLVNFLIVNHHKLYFTFNLWNITKEIVIGNNYLMFTWAAIIEEVVLIIITSYYFLATSNEFVRNIRISKITQCGQTFNPVPLFNFIKNSNPKIRKYAEETLLLMFERIPLKKDIDLNKWEFKNLLLDGLSDINPNVRNICYKIFIQLENDAPEIILPWIIESLESPNYDKVIQITKSLLETDISLIKEIPQYLIADLIKDPEWRLKLLGLKLLSRLIKTANKLILEIDFKKLIDHPYSKVQVEILNILAESSLNVPYEIIIDKIFHQNNEISAAAIRNIKNIPLEQINKKMISKIIPLMEDPSSAVRASIFEVVARIGKFKKYNVPIFPFLEGITDLSEDVRRSSVSALERYYQEVPSLLNIDNIINKIDPHNSDILNSIISLLGRLWEYNPDKILTALLIFIKFENEQLKENISEILVEKYKSSPHLIMQNLIKIPDISGFISKGIISKTLIKIGKNDPENVIPKLTNYLENSDDDIRLNSIVSLDGLVDDFAQKINVKTLLQLLRMDKNKQIKKETSKIISKIAKMNPNIVMPYISDFIEVSIEQESSVKIVLIKSLLDIAKNSPELIPVRLIFNLLADDDSFIRETCTKILGFIGYKDPLSVIDILINRAMIDKEWIVREASVASLGNIIKHVENKEKIIEKLIFLLDDEQNWVRRSALNILATIKEVNQNQLPFSKLLKCLKNKDSNVREAAAKLLRIFSNQIDQVFDEIIELLEDDSKEVRESSINSFVDIIKNVGLNRIISKLLKNLSDEGSLEIQRSIALILGRTAKYEDEKIKKRAIALLKIRCEMSQDPVICKTLQQLKES